MQRDEPTMPFAAALSTEAQRTARSFHGLPLFRGASLRGSRFAPYYAKLLNDYSTSDATVISGEIDNFFFSTRALADAEQKAAEAFGADFALFGSNGTTISNQIAVRALTTRPSRVLVDRSCHQSIHFALASSAADINYLVSHQIDEAAGRSAICLRELLAKMQSAEAERRPYDLVVLNAHSYDGVMLRLSQVFGAVRDSVTQQPAFLVDEAWAGCAPFNSASRGETAMAAAAVLRPNTAVISTISIHKSLSALRQASAIFARGPAELAGKLRRARFMLHSTSPSYPILASIDLARAQIVADGDELTSRARRLADLLRTQISEKGIQSYKVIETALPTAFRTHIAIDPTKVHIDVRDTGFSPQEVKRLLHDRHGIYVNRITDAAILINVHIGVSDEDIFALVDALLDIAGHAPRTARSFVIPYPPGVPIIIPGDTITQFQRECVQAAHRCGLTVVNV